MSYVQRKNIETSRRMRSRNTCSFHRSQNGILARVCSLQTGVFVNIFRHRSNVPIADQGWPVSSPIDKNASISPLERYPLFIKWPTTTSNLGDCQTIVLSNLYAIALTRSCYHRRFDREKIHSRFGWGQRFSNLSKKFLEKWLKMDVQKIPSDLRSFPSSLGTDRTLLSKVYLEQRARNLPLGNFHKIKILLLFSSNVEKQRMSNLFFFN